MRREGRGIQRFDRQSRPVITITFGFAAGLMFVDAVVVHPVVPNSAAIATLVPSRNARHALAPTLFVSSNHDRAFGSVQFRVQQRHALMAGFLTL
jgi:hypothetical protein